MHGAVAGRGACTQHSRLSDEDLHWFNEGTHQRLYDKLGAHLELVDGVAGTRFAVWAPNAEAVSVVGDFNGWRSGADALVPRASSGLWEGFVPGAQTGARYKYEIRSRVDGLTVLKADPLGFHHETPPETASIVWPLDYHWGDAEWMATRAARNRTSAPISIYELHLGSMWRHDQPPHPPLSYRELAPRLADYMLELGFTHVELLPVMEHPLTASWGYQVTGYFAPTSRYGTPQDFMFLIDHLHQRGLGVILDWVPAHFPTDQHGLARFDGTHLYEHEDPRRGFHPDWTTCIFNYGRHEVRSFLISSALYWLDEYHVDGLRVDGVASMLYLDYSRKPGEWLPNRHGGRENLEAVSLLQELNAAVYARFPDVQTIAEESTSWPLVSKPAYLGGLGFGLKWDLGFMHDTLGYLAREPVHRKFHHAQLTFRSLYAMNESFVLPLSHDEVVHGKGSLLGKMPGDEWQRFANLRLLFAYAFAQPGKKLLFMGAELAQPSEWSHDGALPWALLDHPSHRGVQRLVRDLNRCYREHPALHELDCDAGGLSWIEANDADQSIYALLRHASGPHPAVLAVFNFTPVVRYGYRVGVPQPGMYRELLNTDAREYGGSGMGNLGGVEATREAWHGYACSLALTLPPLGAVFLRAP